jgi:predicted TIM-barrel fold metal-dependent hydrolase
MASLPLLIDTHQHWWNVEQFHLAWHRDFPLLDRSFGPRDYAAQFAPVADKVRIESALWMECDVDVSEQIDEARWVRETGRDTNLAGLIAGSRPEHDGFAAHLEALAKVDEVRGVRRVLFSQPDETSQSALFRDNIRRLTDYDWTFDLCVSAQQLPVAAELARACPDVRFILDHCGNPIVSEGTGEAFARWRSDLQTIAREPNVTVKVSGIIASAQPGWTTETLRPFVETVVETFGATRALWGSDWPVCLIRARLADWVSSTLELAQSWSEVERRAVFEETARRVYKI